MEYFWGSVKLMLFVYALAAVVSFIMAWVIRLIFVGIKAQKAHADSRNGAKAKAPLKPGDAASKGTA
jgi:hypothetical protein